MSGGVTSVSLREVAWPRFLRAPDGQLVARLYEPGLRRAVRYDRCCAYFSSSVLAAAASGFGAFIQRILDGAITKKPALRLLVNEELAEPDVRALLDAGDDAPLIDALLARLGTPATALQKGRLEMLAWLARDGWLEMKVGVIPSSLCLIAAMFAPGVEWALGLLLPRSALSQMDVPTRISYVMAVVTPPERTAAASFTAVPRSLAAAAGPAIAGAVFAAGWQAAAFIACGLLKIAYDLALLWAFRHLRPPEEREAAAGTP